MLGKISPSSVAAQRLLRVESLPIERILPGGVVGYVDDLLNLGNKFFDSGFDSLFEGYINHAAAVMPNGTYFIEDQI